MDEFSYISATCTLDFKQLIDLENLGFCRNAPLCESLASSNSDAGHKSSSSICPRSADKYFYPPRTWLVFLKGRSETVFAVKPPLTAILWHLFFSTTSFQLFFEDL